MEKLTRDLMELLRSAGESTDLLEAIWCDDGPPIQATVVAVVSAGIQVPRSYLARLTDLNEWFDLDEEVEALRPRAVLES